MQIILMFAYSGRECSSNIWSSKEILDPSFAEGTHTIIAVDPARMHPNHYMATAWTKEWPNQNQQQQRSPPWESGSRHLSFISNQWATLMYLMETCWSCETNRMNPTHNCTRLSLSLLLNIILRKKLHANRYSVPIVKHAWFTRIRLGKVHRCTQMLQWATNKHWLAPINDQYYTASFFPCVFFFRSTSWASFLITNPHPMKLIDQQTFQSKTHTKQTHLVAAGFFWGSHQSTLAPNHGI